MVIPRFAFLIFAASFLAVITLKAAPSVDSSIDPGAHAHFPIFGTITISHQKSEKINPHSFSLDAKPLEASFVKDVKMSTSEESYLSIYSFQLGEKEGGSYILPSISVKIDGKIYQSIPSIYDVMGTSAASAPLPSSSKDVRPPPQFRLQASIQGPSTLYPGERTKLFYEISYNRNIDLTFSQLPMIHPDHFQKIGDVQIRDGAIGDLTVQELTQEVEASQIGTFTLGPSAIVGRSYILDGGQKIYDPLQLKAEAPAVTVEVKPFPPSGQPPSFTGALGRLKVKASLDSPSAAMVGDTVQMEIAASEVSNLFELRLPPLNCQPGFSGFFQMSDLPPLAQVEGDAKIFHIDLRPLTSLTKEIPSIQMSSFDPATEKYIVKLTSSIPLTITEKQIDDPSFTPIPFLNEFPPSKQWPPPTPPPLNSAKREASLIPSPLHGSKKSGALWMLLACCVFLPLQYFGAAWWKNRPRPLTPSPEKLLKQALKKGDLKGVEQAFWQLLWEKGIVTQGMRQLGKIPKEKKMAGISSFLFQLQALQWGEEKSFDMGQLKKSALVLFNDVNK